MLGKWLASVATTFEGGDRRLRDPSFGLNPLRLSRDHVLGADTIFFAMISAASLSRSSARGQHLAHEVAIGLLLNQFDCNYPA